jgi:hypothetical protein
MRRVASDASVWLRARLIVRPSLHPSSILRYTSAPDAEGTLGGLVNLGQASELGLILHRAIERAGLCNSDPVCADHEPDAANSSIHGAACHACLLVAEIAASATTAISTAQHSLTRSATLASSPSHDSRTPSLPSSRSSATPTCIPSQLPTAP